MLSQAQARSEIRLLWEIIQDFGPKRNCDPSLYQTFASNQIIVKQGIDGSARKPVLIQDTGYMVEKTYYDVAPYVGAFGAYLMPQ